MKIQTEKISGEQPEKGIDLSIVIPAYNEEKRIGTTLERILGFFRQRDLSWEILVVDDGSSDGTRDLVGNMTGALPVRLICQGSNKGKGAAVRRGMLEARGAYRLFSDADLSTPIEEIDKLLKTVRDGADIAIGSRAMRDSVLEVRQRWYRELMGRIFNFLVRRLLLGGFRDTQCGFKLFTSRAAEDIFPVQRLSGWAFDVETLLLAKKFGFRTVEVPVRWINSSSSKVNALRDGFTMFRDIIVLRFRRFPSRKTKEDSR